MPDESPDVAQPAPPPDPNALAAAPPPVEPPGSAGSKVWGAVWPLLLIGAAVSVMFLLTTLVTISENPGASQGYRVGYLFGSLFGALVLPTLIGWLASRKKTPPRRIKIFATVFAGVGISLTLLGSVGRVQNLTQPADKTLEAKKEAAQLLKEAAGTKPANSTSTAFFDKDAGALVRDWFRQILELRKKHEQDSAQYAAALGKLYSAESFSSSDKMRQTMEAVDGVQKVDQDFADAFARLSDDLGAKVQASSLSARDKADFMSGVKKGMGNSETFAAWRDVQKKEIEWSQATHGFYAFTLEQSSAIKAQNGKVFIANRSIREEFNKRLHECQELRNSMISANDIFLAKQQATMKETGINESDLGLKK